jgi:hypothetical protein
MSKQAKITDFTPDRHNANKGTEKGAIVLDDSITQLGLGRSIVVDKNGNIIAGNKTQEAAVQNGLEDAIVIKTDGKKLVVVQRDDLDLYSPTDDRARLLGIYDNRSSELNLEWDKDNLDLLLHNIQSDEISVQAALSELASENDLYFGDEPELTDPEPQIDRAEELNEKWQVKRGDLWAIGNHKLLCGDSTLEEDVERVMGGERASFEFSDPPYEINTIGGGVLKNSAHMKAIKDSNLDSFDPSMLAMIAPTALFCCNKILVPRYIDLAKKLKIGWDICFYKKSQTPPNYGGHMMTDTEYLMLIGTQSPNSGLDKETYSKAYLGDRDNDSIVDWQKPIGLMTKFFLLYSSRGDLVIDRYGGTGSTMVACEQLSRKCRMTEILPKYCAVILERLSDMGITPELITDSD